MACPESKWLDHKIIMHLHIIIIPTKIFNECSITRILNIHIWGGKGCDSVARNKTYLTKHKMSSFIFKLYTNTHNAMPFCHDNQAHLWKVEYLADRQGFTRYTNFNCVKSGGV